jgi:hypothetical protein
VDTVGGPGETGLVGVISSGAVVEAAGGNAISLAT